jgi:hypothetical protein
MRCGVSGNLITKISANMEPATGIVANNRRIVRIAWAVWLPPSVASKPVCDRISPEAQLPIATPSLRIQDPQAENAPSRLWWVSS